jgi:hypothetical protein
MDKIVQNIHERNAQEFGIPFEQISEILKDHNSFAKREALSIKEVRPGVTLSTQVVELGEGNFTNVYDLSVSQTGAHLSSKIVAYTHPILLHRFFANDGHVIAGINGGFLYVSDDTEGIGKQGPQEANLNWCIRDGLLTSLPAADRPALFTTGGKLHAREVVARGTIKVGDRNFSWLGGEPLMHTKRGEKPLEYDPNVITLFNPACGTVAYSDPQDKKSPRCLDMNSYHTPTHQEVTALVIEERDEVMVVSRIQEGGEWAYSRETLSCRFPSRKPRE